MKHAGTRYTKTATGWTRYTLAFMSYCQWHDKHAGRYPEPQRLHGAGHRHSLQGPERKYHVWPVIEQCGLEVK